MTASVGEHTIRTTVLEPTGSVAVHAIQTGSVRVRANQVRGKGSGTLRQLKTFAGQAWSDWLPIYAWVIEHPEGVIVVDTGETAKTMIPGYFPGWHPYFRRGVELRVHPDEEIGPQLQDRWIDPRDVQKVIMTHLHTDHAGGLHHFSGSDVLIHREAFAAASGTMGRLRGYLPNRWPDWLRPTLIDFEPTPFGPFERSLPVTRAGDVVLVPTPGHTPSHLSVVVRTDAATHLLAGDTSYTEELMLAGQVDGIAPDDASAADTHRRIRSLADDEPLVYLPSHDPDAKRRLDQHQPVPSQQRA